MDMEPDDLASGEAGPESNAQGGEMRQLLEAHIGALPEGYRKVFMMRAIEELSVEETAAALAIPEATVRTRYFRARNLLRKSMARTPLISARAWTLRCSSPRKTVRG